MIMKKFLLSIAFLTGLTGIAAPGRGAVCFTFDDYFGSNWMFVYYVFKVFIIAAQSFPPVVMTFTNVKYFISI